MDMVYKILLVLPRPISKPICIFWLNLDNWLWSFKKKWKIRFPKPTKVPYSKETVKSWKERGEGRGKASFIPEDIILPNQFEPEELLTDNFNYTINKE